MCLDLTNRVKNLVLFLILAFFSVLYQEFLG